MNRKVIELIRVSTEGQAGEDRAGIPAQRETNRRTARTYGLDIARTIEIVDVSGSSVLACAEMQELLRLIESPEIEGVVAKEFSRLIRPEKYTDYALLEHFIETNTILYLPDGPIDLSSKTGRFLGTIRAAIAGLERREILERMQDAKETMRHAGKHTGGTSSLPYGVGYSKDRRWFYTAEAEKVKQAFALFLSGESSYVEIARKLNIPRSSLRYVLENPIYTGLRVYDEKRDPSASGYVARPDGRQGYRRKIRRSPDEVIRVQVLEGIVSEEDFANVQQIIGLKSQKHWRVRQTVAPRYIYNGFLSCGECGNPLYTHTSKHDFYICKTRHTRERRRRALINADPCTNNYMLRKKLEPKIDYLLGQKLQEAEFVSRLVEDYNESLVRASSSVKNIDCSAVERKLATLEEKQRRILEAFFEGVIDRKQRDERLKDVEGELSTYRRLVSDSSLNARQEPIEDLHSVLQVVAPFAEWEFLKREDRRSLMQRICPEIAVYRYTVKSLKLNFGNSADDGICGGDGVSRSRTAQ